MSFDGKAWSKEYYQKNKELILKKQRGYFSRPEVKERKRKYEQRPEVKERKQAYRQRPEVKERRKVYGKEYHSRPEVKKHYQELSKEYHSRPQVKIRYRKMRKIYQEKNKEWIKEWVKKWGRDNLEERNKRKKKRMKIDKDFLIRCRLTTALWNALKKYSKTGKIRLSKQYGINYKAIIEHLKPFPENLLEYHIDHIIPLSMWDLNNPEHIRKAHMPHNLQWLSKKDNLEKGNRLVIPH